MTRITTGRDPSDYEEVYGARASDIVFPKGLLGSGAEEAMAASLKVKNRNRVTTFTTPEMFRDRVNETFADAAPLSASDGVPAAVYVTNSSDEHTIAAAAVPTCV